MNEDSLIVHYRLVAFLWILMMEKKDESMKVLTYTHNDHTGGWRTNQLSTVVGFDIPGGLISFPGGFIVVALV